MESTKKTMSILTVSPTNNKQRKVKQMFPKRTCFLRSSVAIRNRLTAFRTYGFMKTSHTGTPYPRCADPLDSGILTARLAVASKLKSKVKSSDDDGEEIESISDTNNECSISNLLDPGEPKMTSFEERRKLFDLAEFTICKGRKLGDSFHHSDVDIDVLLANSRQRLGGSAGNYSNFTLTSNKSQSLRHFKEMEAFCLAQNIRLNQGLEFGMAKKF